ncbi:plancitoxin-1-like [Ixodes scapularis]|uniref:plancitoxin-1-like n=1 Tax=Ixodes scapularis TaxID=6945 RepID=UPI001A9E7A3B|nr:plancitoxin-1-like [Ixodes scapularis]
MRNLFLVALCFLANGVRAGDDVYCRDERNQKVEWFVMYKFPANGVIYKQVKRGFNTNGVQFAYFDANTKNLNYWNMSSETLYSQRNPLAFTLAKLFAKKKSPDIAYVTYNDQPFTGEEEPAKDPDRHHGKEYAHSKGILMADATSGMWLVHSTPQFPVNVHMGEFNMTRTARKNGQYFMCLTVPATEVDEIAELLLIQSVIVNHKYGPESVAKKYPQLQALIRGKSLPPSTEVKIAPIKGISRTTFTAIAKPPRWKKDVYTHVVTEQAQSDIWVQSWRRPLFGWLYPVCDRKYSVKDVELLRFNFNSTSYLEYSYLNDHSKFAVAVNKSLFCFSSLNRGSTQFNRGGELLCRDNETVAGLFRRTVAKVEACDATDPSGKPRPPTVTGDTTTTKKPWRWPTTSKRPSGKWPTRAPGSKPTKPAATKRTKKPTKPVTTKTRTPTKKKTKQTITTRPQKVQKTRKSKTQ